MEVTDEIYQKSAVLLKLPNKWCVFSFPTQRHRVGFLRHAKAHNEILQNPQLNWQTKLKNYKSVTSIKTKCNPCIDPKVLPMF